MNECPDPRNVDWNDGKQVKEFYDACHSMTRVELLSYEDKYTIPLIQRWRADDRQRLHDMFPESKAWADAVAALTLEEMDSGKMEPLADQLRKMRGLPLIMAWSQATMHGIDQFERVKRIHQHCAEIVLNLFELPQPGKPWNPVPK